ncbi:sulfite exporter TauE/SafE family protein [Halomonas korlensis]|uniref:Probable membrane transporter protein n=1 Tax=Halomonas korlensis TaxID=463301 RepID=A0A1I7GIG0_9GAMM|nr:sulfite exporter TauE/SafE family protein [Halomonas korlensis]SFU48214.1 Sulfite exporter TauE/SafE [Halomonas korlensis]
MSLSSLLIFLTSAFIGGYFQTLIGFAMGMVVMAFCVTLGVTTVAETALALNVLSLTNAAVVLPKIWRHTDWPGLLMSMLGLVPGTIGGVFLLDMLSSNYTWALRLLVGAFIILGGLALFLQPQPRTQRSGPASFTAAGAAAGVMGGMFGIAGPPVVFHLYSQPTSILTIRATLIMGFAALAAVRLVTVAAEPDMDMHTGLTTGIFAVPVVILASWLCGRFPPPASPTAVRRIAFIMLIAMGAFIILTTLFGAS